MNETMVSTQPNFSKGRHIEPHHDSSRVQSQWALLLATLFLIASGFFVAKMPVRPELAWVSSVFVVGLALPAMQVLVRWLGVRQGALLLIALGIFAVLIESFAVITGLPYGHFQYGEKIGAKIFGLVPWTVPFAWTPLLLGAMAIGKRWTSTPAQAIILSALLLVAMDLVLDPGAVAQGFWTWSFPGAYHKIPLSNFVGWFVSGVLGSLLFERFAGTAIELPPIQLLSSAFLILSFWSSACLWMGLWIPALIGIALWLLAGFHLFSLPAPQRALASQHALAAQEN